MYRSGYFGTSHVTSDCMIKKGNRDGVLTRVQSHTSFEVSSVDPPSRRRPALSKYRHEAPPAFTSLRQMVKPQNAGVTIVNVYNCEKDRVMQLPKKQPKQKMMMTRMVEKTNGCPDGHQCMTTDEDRNNVLRPEKVLPRWCEREEANDCRHLMSMDDYDTEIAKLEWDAFYETQTKKKKDDGRGKAIKCQCKEDNDEVAVTMTGHATGAFYGTTETQKMCQNAIQLVLKCEKELQQLQFTSSSVLPQTGECLAKLRWVHDCLKLFHTHFRELQMETDEKLQVRTGNNLTIKMTAPGKHELPFPKHLH